MSEGVDCTSGGREALKHTIISKLRQLFFAWSRGQTKKNGNVNVRTETKPDVAHQNGRCSLNRNPVVQAKQNSFKGHMTSW